MEKIMKREGTSPLLSTNPFVGYIVGRSGVGGLEKRILLM
jgi:hypothetical protein